MVLGLGGMLAGAGGIAGCAYPVQGQPLERLTSGLGITVEGQAYDPPVMRLGSMPFHAWYSPYVPLGINDLGQHAYLPAGSLDLRNRETSRGILYTAHGGFLDISHVRNAIDLTRFVYDYTFDGFTSGLTELRFLAAEPDTYIVTLNPPDEWKLHDHDAEASPMPHEDARLAALGVAARVAYLMTTWHEVLTWFGYKGMGVITEKPSAFSYDDAASHRVGVEVAMRALRNQPDPTRFDAQVTGELFDYLIELGVLPVEENRKRMKAVKGQWWDRGEPKLRIVDLGMDDGPLTAHIVDQRLTPVTWGWDPDESYGGKRVNDLFDVHIQMKTAEAGKIRQAMHIDDSRPIHPRTDFDRLLRILMSGAMP